jgi:hypothetical protein
VREADVRLIVISGRQRRFASWASDVLVYVVVLNLFVEFNDKIVIDSFWISILTALLLKLLLDVILSVEHRVSDWFGAQEGAAWKVGSLLVTWGILFLSKFVILEVVDLVFGGHVELGKFLDVIVLVIALMVARELLARAYAALAPTEGELDEAGLPASGEIRVGRKGT